MKIAVSGKGGVGKTTLSALLCRGLETAGRDVVAIDADSNPTLAYSLGIRHAQDITPISEMETLIREKTGAEKGSYGAYFKMNPDVSDIPTRFKHVSGKVQLLVMGAVRQGGGGCACPEYVLIKNLIGYLLLNNRQDMIIDMEAGLEHLGRAVTEKVDMLLIVSQPNRASCITAKRIYKLATEIGLKRVFGVGNMVHGDADRDYLKQQIKEFEFLAFFPFLTKVLDLDKQGGNLYELSKLKTLTGKLIDQIEEKKISKS